MAESAILPLLAGLVSGAFAALVWRAWARGRRAHALAWALGLTSYAAASFVEAYVDAWDWTVLLYRLYFPLAAATVGLLGLGTLLLALPPRAARPAVAVTTLLVLLTAAGQFLVPLDPAALAGKGSSVGAQPIQLPNPGRIGFLLLNIAGGLALIGGALWSGWRTRRAGVLLIGLGAILPAAGGSLATLTRIDVRVLLQLLGIVVMFAGYLQGRGERPRAAPAASEA